MHIYLAAFIILKKYVEFALIENIINKVTTDNQRGQENKITTMKKRTIEKELKK